MTKGIGPMETSDARQQLWAVGRMFTNGSTPLRCRSFRYGVVLTVVRKDHGYVERYLVRDSQGRHGLAY